MCARSAHACADTPVRPCAVQVTFFQQGWLPCLTEEGGWLTRARPMQPWTRTDITPHSLHHATPITVRFCSFVLLHAHTCTCAHTRTGQLILDTPSSLAKAPDGNGGVFRALQQAGVLDKLAAEGAWQAEAY